MQFHEKLLNDLFRFFFLSKKAIKIFKSLSEMNIQVTEMAINLVAMSVKYADREDVAALYQSRNITFTSASHL